ncbi:MAG: cysteine desulfurase family protein [bacterium]
MNKKIQSKIYFDHAATTATDPRVLKAMMPYMSEKYGNASSAHSFGQGAMSGVNKSRKILAEFLNCAMDEIIFTSGATESNNLALQGFLRNASTRLNASGKQPLHIITSQIEHPSVLDVCKALEREGAEISYVGVNREGMVLADDIKNAIKDNTVLVSIMYVNNETGVIQPIREIGKMIEKYNKYVNTPLAPLKRGMNSNAGGCRILFHTDATQAVNYCECNTKYLHVDMLSLSAHKIYGPKGAGCLYVKKGIPLQPVHYGGHQENGLRSGTYNTSGIVGLGRAVEIIANEREKIKIEKDRYLIFSAGNKKIKKLRDRIIKEITKKIPDILINGSMENRISSNLNLSFKNIEGESLMIMLDMDGIAVSTGSACSSGMTESSHVLKAMGATERMAQGSIRITLGRNNTLREVEYFVAKLEGVVNKLRQFAGKK